MTEIFKSGELLSEEDHHLAPENLFTEDSGIETEEHASESEAPKSTAAEPTITSRSAAIPAAISPAAVDSNVLPTVFYVNMIPDPPSKLRKELRKTKQAVLDTRTFATGVAEKMVKAKIDQGNFLVGGQLDQKQAGSFRSKAHEYALRNKVSWLASGSEIRQEETFTDTPGGLHARIITLALKDFAVNKVVYDQFEGIIKQIVESINRTAGFSGSVQYIVFLTVFLYDEIAQTVDPKLRLLSFQADAQTYEVTRRKNQTEKMATLKMSFSGIDWDFNLVKFNKVWKTIEQGIIDEGTKASDPNTIVDIPI